MPPRAPASSPRNVVTRALSTSGRGLPGPPGRRAGLGHTRTPGLLYRIRRLGGRARTTDNGSNEHSPASPRAARRFDRVEGSPSRINTVATSGPGSPARPPAQGNCAADGATDTGTRVLSLAAIDSPPSSRAGHPSGRTTGPAGRGCRHASRTRTDSRQAGFIRRDTAAQRTVSAQIGSGPTRRHARDPFRRSKSSGMLSAPGPRHRDGPTSPRGSPDHAARKSWHRSRSVMSDGSHHAPDAGATSPPPLARSIPAPSPGGDARLIYQKPSAGQSPGGDACGRRPGSGRRRG